MSAGTIFALASGAPPAAIAVVRISGPKAFATVEQLSGKLVPPPRRAVLRTLHDGDILLDEALVLAFAAPNSATGEDVAELHLHGGRATVAAVLEALAHQDGLRLAQSGEFTRRAFANGRIDLLQAEGLGELLAAETESARRAALGLIKGTLSGRIADWTRRIVAASARVEAAIDFAEEDDVQPWPERAAVLAALAAEIDGVLAAPPVERLREGFRVVVAGPPNAGKSSLVNALVERDVAIVAHIAGTTRDLVEAPVRLRGEAINLVDTAGLRSDSDDPIEREGMARARAAMRSADLVLWLGQEADLPEGAWQVTGKADLQRGPGRQVSIKTGEGLNELRTALGQAAARVTCNDELGLNLRQREELRHAVLHLRDAADAEPVLTAEALRLARAGLDKLSGRANTDAVLDEIFGRFCLGK